MKSVLSLRKELTEKGIEYPTDAKRPALEALLNGVKDAPAVVLYSATAQTDKDTILIKDKLGNTIRIYHVDQFRDAAQNEKRDVYELFAEKARGYATKNGGYIEYPIKT